MAESSFHDELFIFLPPIEGMPSMAKFGISEKIKDF
jgi:hypothetical protein